MAAVSVVPDPPVEPSPARLLANKGELARLLRCSKPTLNELMDRYPDFPVEERGTHGIEWRFDVARVQAFLAEKRESERRDAEARAEMFRQFTLPIDDVAGDEGKVLSPQQRLARARALKAEREIALETGFLLPGAETRSVLQVALSKLGRFLDQVPSRQGRLYNLPDEVVRAMRRDIEEQRRDFVAEIKAFLLRDAAAEDRAA